MYLAKEAGQCQSPYIFTAVFLTLLTFCKMSGISPVTLLIKQENNFDLFWQGHVVKRQKPR